MSGSRTLLIAFVILLPAASVWSGTHAAASPVRDRESWSRRYDGTGRDDYPWFVAVSPDGTSVFVTGRSYGATDPPGFDFATTAYDAVTGRTLWTRRYDGPGHGWDTPSDLAVSPDSSAVFVTGYSVGLGTAGDAATVAYDAASGAVLWVHRYEGPSDGADDTNETAVALAMSSDGSVLFMFGGGETEGFVRVAFDAATGAELSLTSFGDAVDASISALEVSPDGSTVFVTGSRYFPRTSDDFITAAYDAATGTELWTSRYNGPGSDNDSPLAFGISPDGTTVFVMGGSIGSGMRAADATVAYDAATGDRIWVRRFHTADIGAIADAPLAVAPDGSAVYVTDARGRRRASTDFVTFAYDAATGATLWERGYNSRGDRPDYGGAVAVSADGSTAFVSGTSFGATSRADIVTVAYDAATGVRLWVRRYDGRAGGGDSVGAVAASPNGSAVFVTGITQTPSDESDFATFAYTTT